MRSTPEAEAVYRAETVLDPVTRQFRTMRELGAYVDQLVESDWFIEQFPWVTYGPEVYARSSSARFSQCWDDGVLGIVNNPRHRTVGVVLHELAHYVQSDPAAEHGPMFRGAMLLLVRQEMGFHAWVELVEAYRQENLAPAVDIRLESV